jgi:murein DD-endopeptidase MepM/ murein hydrolase activator NlpD
VYPYLRDNNNQYTQSSLLLLGATATAGYGNAVEVTHPNGMMTRYAHLSRIDVRPGQLVKAGATLGGLGSTGRSTGPHLHFEVRINDRAVNPRPFLEAAPDVLKEVRRAGSPRPAAAAAR